MRRRQFIAGIGGTAVWTFRARAQQPTPRVAFVSARSEQASLYVVDAFRKGLGETGYVEERNLTVEYHWLDGQFDRLPALMADLIRRRVAVIATPSSTLIASAAKARCDAAADQGLTNATVGGGCCALARNAHAAALPRPAMKSRRRICDTSASISSRSGE